jgi:hypothetical protein
MSEEQRRSYISREENLPDMVGTAACPEDTEDRNGHYIKMKVIVVFLQRCHVPMGII